MVVAEVVQEHLHTTATLPPSLHPSEMIIIPSVHVQLIPENLDSTACECFIMYAFINARHHGFCCHWVANEYFNNPKSKQIFKCEFQIESLTTVYQGNGQAACCE
jgi:hypothetical protein